MIYPENIRLIASDLDGTLLHPLGTQALKEGTCDLIRQWLDKGGLFVAASGRQYANLRLIFEPIKDDILYICENGCLVICDGKILMEAALERDLAEKLSLDILENGEGELLISTAWTQFVIPKEDRFFYHMRDTVRVQVERISDISEVKDPILKVSMFSWTGLTNVPPWRERYGSLCTVQTSGAAWLDMTPRNVNKATAMEVLLNHLGIKPSECMAFGDNENDAPLLAMAGCPIAMSDATPDILKMVSQTTDSVEAVLREMVSQRA